jgi:DNA-binding Xre family transcriptional regulator
MFDCQLKMIFLTRKMKQKDFAEKIGITQGNLSLIATGRSFPSFEVMYRICEELDMDVREIWKRVYLNQT